MVTATAERPRVKDLEIDLTKVHCVLPDGATQEDFVFDRHRYVVWIGGRGCAKTASMTFKVMEYVQQWPGAWVLVTAPTWSQLWTFIIPSFKKWMPPEWVAKWNLSGDKMWLDLVNGCRILFRNASNPDSIRGIEFSLWCIDEVAQCDRYLVEVGAPCQRQAGYPKQTIVTGTPEGRNWAFNMFMNPASRIPPVNGKEQISFYKATPLGNPFLPEDYVDELKALYSGNPTMAAQEIYGEVVAFEGLVFPNFRWDTHVKKPEKVEFRRVLGGMDFGMTDPSVILLMGMDDSNRRWVFKEFYMKQAGMRPLETAARWRAEYKTQVYFADPHNPHEIATMNGAMIPVVKGDARAIETRIRVINNLLEDKPGGPGLYISPECPNLIAEMQTYAHARDTQLEEKFSDTLKKKQADHAIDAMGYMILGSMASQQGHNIKQIIFG